jgi:hypothetical protein
MTAESLLQLTRADLAAQRQAHRCSSATVDPVQLGSGTAAAMLVLVDRRLLAVSIPSRADGAC